MKKITTKAISHKDILAIFKAKFPTLETKMWWKKAPASIRVRLMDGTDVIFTYFAADSWKIESIKMWEASVDGI